MDDHLQLLKIEILAECAKINPSGVIPSISGENIFKSQETNKGSDNQETFRRFIRNGNLCDLPLDAYLLILPNVILEVLDSQHSVSDGSKLGLSDTSDTLIFTRPVPPWTSETVQNELTASLKETIAGLYPESFDLSAIAKSSDRGALIVHIPGRNGNYLYPLSDFKSRCLKAVKEGYYHNIFSLLRLFCEYEMESSIEGCYIAFNAFWKYFPENVSNLVCESDL